MIKYRQHSGGLKESMQEIVEIKTKGDLVRILLENYAPYITNITLDNVHIKPYGYDERIDWDTHVVTIDGVGAVGFTSAMID